MAWDPLERGKAAEKRHSAAKHAQRGVGKRDRVLERGQEIERSHNRAKNNPRWRQASKDRTQFDDEEYAGWRKRYFRKVRPDLDPQSTTSRILEFFGADDPYVDDRRSYDYRAQKAAADPTDPRNIASIFSDDGLSDIMAVPSFVQGGKQVDNEATKYGLSEEEAIASAQYDIASRRAAFIQEHGREPDEDEVAQIENDVATRYLDPRTRDEKMAGMFLGALSMPMAGFGEEAAAGAMSLLPGGGTYDEELAKARAIQERAAMFEQGFTPRNIASGAMGLAGLGPILGATTGLGNVAVRGGRAALGLTPQATSLLGRGAANVGAGATGWTAWEAADEFGAGQGGIEGRLGNIASNELINSAISGGLIFPAISGLGLGVSEGAKAIGRGAKKVGKKSVSAGKKAVQALWKAEAKPKPLPYTPGDIPPPMWPTRKPGLAPGMDRITNAGNGTVRSDINRAFRKRAKPVDPRAGIGAAMVPAGAATGGLIYASQRDRNRK